MKELFIETAKECGVDPKVVEDVVDSFFHYLKRKMSAKRFSAMQSFDKVKTNFSLMGLGKLIVYNKTKKRHDESRKSTQDQVHV